MPAVSFSSWHARRRDDEHPKISLPKLLPSQPSSPRAYWSALPASVDGVVGLSVLDFAQRVAEGGLRTFESAINQEIQGRFYRCAVTGSPLSAAFFSPSQASSCS